MVLALGVVLVVAVAAFAQAVSGFGFALLAVPALALLAGAKEAVVATSVLGVVLTLVMTLQSRGHVRWPSAALVTAVSLLGMPLGLLVLTRVDEHVLELVIGIAVLVLTLALWRGLRVPAGRPVEAGAGFLSGVLATSVGMSGPPVVVAFRSADLPPRSFRGTLAAVFLVQGLVALVAFGATGNVTAEVLVIAAAGLPGLVGGWWFGRTVVAHVDGARFGRVVLGMLAVSGVVSVAGAVLG
jgi:uncharacterized protein